MWKPPQGFGPSRNQVVASRLRFPRLFLQLRTSLRPVYRDQLGIDQQHTRSLTDTLLPKLIPFGGSSPHFNYTATAYNLKRRASYTYAYVKKPVDGLEPPPLTSLTPWSWTGNIIPSPSSAPSDMYGTAQAFNGLQVSVNALSLLDYTGSKQRKFEVATLLRRLLCYKPPILYLTLMKPNPASPHQYLRHWQPSSLKVSGLALIQV